MTNDLRRGYLPDGKDRQHPVKDPDDVSVIATPAMWVNAGVMTWYAIANVPTTPPVPADGA
jgi:hypothetical protein